MTGALDNTFLTLLLNPRARPTPNPATGKAASHHRFRIDGLIDTLSSQGTKLIVPTPALSEALTFTDNPQGYINLLRDYSCIELVGFDERAMVELALINKQAIESGDKKSGVTAQWQHVKLDRQIVAIAKVSGATVLYTDDGDQAKFAEYSGLKVCHTWDLPLVGKHAQPNLFDGLKEENG